MLSSILHLIMNSTLPILLASTLLLVACKFPKQKSERESDSFMGIPKISENEDRGIKEVLDRFGGRCDYGVEEKVDNQYKQTNFWLKLSNSYFLDSSSNVAEFESSIIAFIFYKNLKKERKRYNKIHCILSFSNREKLEFFYTTEQLEQIETKLQLANKIVNYIKVKDFEALKKSLIIDCAIFNFDKSLLVSNLEKVELKLGDIVEYIPNGFKFSKTKSGCDILCVSGLIKRKNEKNSYLSIFINSSNRDDKILFLNYQPYLDI